MPRAATIALFVSLPTLTCAYLLASTASADPQQPQQWAFEETFDGDPAAPSQDLLPRRFEFVATHRTHPQEIFTRDFPPFLADHDEQCNGPDPSVSPLPQHEVVTSQSSSGTRPDASFFLCKNHMMSSMGQVDAYSNSSFWPRQEFDFRNGGTLEFDVNINLGHTNRQWWEVLITPRDQMRVGPGPVESALDEVYPRDRIVFDFQQLVRRIKVGTGEQAPNGWLANEREFLTYDWAYWDALHPDDPALLDRRIRRKMRIEFEDERITWGIETEDGSFDEFSVDVPGGLPFTRGLVLFKTHAYTPAQHGNADTYTFHWDNVRFSGPLVGRYRRFEASDVVYLQRNGPRPIGDAQTVTVELPQRGLAANPVLFGQIHGLLNGQALVSINDGPDIAILPDQFADGRCTSGQWRDWTSFRLPLEREWLQPGTNTLRWTVGPRPDCAVDDGWWDGFSVKFLQVQLDLRRPPPP